MANNFAHPYNRRRVLTINDLPDDDLLAIFDFYVFRYQDAYFCEPQVSDNNRRRNIESWQSLVHVCRRWRALVFESPRRLKLQLFCTPERSRRRSLDVWPPILLLIRGFVSNSEASLDALLKHNNRICWIDLSFFRTPRQKIIWAAMQVPFPELESLTLSSGDPYMPVLPDSILDGSAPRLRYLSLNSFPFPALPKLLMSATHLVNLHLDNIPNSGYISPDAMATCLSVLTSLETFRLQFESPQSHPDPKSRRPFPLIRFVLPTLTMFWFIGAIKYVEEFVARIDAPRLSCFSPKFFGDIDFDTQELNHFIIRTPTLGAYNEAHLVFRGDGARVTLRQSHPEPSGNIMVNMEIFKLPKPHRSTVAQICTLLHHLLTLTVEELYIDGDIIQLFVWGGDNTKWLDLFLLFTAVKNLYISDAFLPRFVLVLQELTRGRITEVLPSLQNILFEGSLPSSKADQEDIARFISARQHPIAVSVWIGVNSYEVDG